MERLGIFPGGKDLEASHYLSLPVDMCLSNDNLYISDSGLGQVIRLDRSGQYIGTIGRRGQGPGDLAVPGCIAGSVNGDLFVAEARRIQRFSSQGSFKSIFKIYHIASDMIADGRDLLVNPIFGQFGSEKEPLIIRYDSLGNRARSFGERIDRPGHATMDSRAYLAMIDRRLVVIFKYYPILRFYEEDGTLTKQARVAIPIMSEIEKYNNDNDFTNPMPGIVNLARTVAGIQIFHDRIFILLHLPRIEIHEIDEAGNDLRAYYFDEPKDIIDYGGFLVAPFGKDLCAYVASVSEKDACLWILKMGPISRDFSNLNKGGSPR